MKAQQLLAQTNQAIISFTFDGSTFNIACELHGIKPATPMYNALEANQFLPFYDLDHSSYQFITPEHWAELTALHVGTSAH